MLSKGWEELTGSGGEGMVVKPLEFSAKSRRGLVQPAVKRRGREYLRIIYGYRASRVSFFVRSGSGWPKAFSKPSIHCGDSQVPLAS